MASQLTAGQIKSRAIRRAFPGALGLPEGSVMDPQQLNEFVEQITDELCQGAELTYLYLADNFVANQSRYCWAPLQEYRGAIVTPTSASGLSPYNIPAARIVTIQEGLRLFPTALTDIVATTGYVATVVMLNGGSGYGAVTCTFSAPPTTGLNPVTATGTPVVVGGVITSVTLTNPGAGYAQPPTVTFSSGTAQAVCTILPTQYVGPNWIFLEGQTDIVLYPAPTFDASGGLTIHGIGRVDPSWIQTDAALCPLPVLTQDAIVRGVAWMLCEDPARKGQLYREYWHVRNRVVSDAQSISETARNRVNPVGYGSFSGPLSNGGAWPL